ncbi:MAG: outer membrane beta-barrel protein [Bacteroidota bacterium]
MKRIFLLFLLLSSGVLSTQAQEETPKFYLGLSYGRTFPLGDFADSDFTNPDAGFAKSGSKFDIFLGFPIDEKLTVTGVIRYQNFATEIDDLINDFTEANPGVQFTGSTENWQTFYLLAGLAYRIKVSRKFSFSPRFGLGPFFVKNPSVNVMNNGGTILTGFSRSSETGVGLGYELGIGLRNDLGRHFSLMPTFTVSGGFVSIQDVVNATDNVVVTADYSPKILTFNLGLSLAYRFY